MNESFFQVLSILFGYNNSLNIKYFILISYFEWSKGISVSFWPWTIKTGQLTPIILFKLSNVYLAIRVPILPTKELTKFLTEAKGLIKTKHLGLRDFFSYGFFSNYKAIPVPMDLPITIILFYWNPNLEMTNS